MFLTVGAPRVRLVNGADVNILRGRVEYRHGNAWGKVCDDYWDDQDSRVVCHQLGFGTHTSFTTHTTTPRTIDVFGMDTGAYFLMDNLFCFGSEIALHHCAHNGWENHNCYYYEAVGLYCSSKGPSVSVCDIVLYYTIVYVQVNCIWLPLIPLYALALWC